MHVSRTSRSATKVVHPLMWLARCTRSCVSTLALNCRWAYLYCDGNAVVLINPIGGWQPSPHGALPGYHAFSEGGVICPANTFLFVCIEAETLDMTSRDMPALSFFFQLPFVSPGGRHFRYISLEFYFFLFRRLYPTAKLFQLNYKIEVLKLRINPISLCFSISLYLQFYFDLFCPVSTLEVQYRFIDYGHVRSQ